MIKSISVEKLNDINSSLANQLITLAEKLEISAEDKRNNVKPNFWIDIDIVENKVYVSVDNGYDISSSIEVPSNDAEKILAILN